MGKKGSAVPEGLGKELSWSITRVYRKTWPNGPRSQTENSTAFKRKVKPYFQKKEASLHWKHILFFLERNAVFCFGVFLLSVVSKLRAVLQQLPAAVPSPFTIGSEETPWSNEWQDGKHWVLFALALILLLLAMEPCWYEHNMDALFLV